jgi:hypothetical protein
MIESWADPDHRPSGGFSREQGFSGNFVEVTDVVRVRLLTGK